MLGRALHVERLVWAFGVELAEEGIETVLLGLVLVISLIFYLFRLWPRIAVHFGGAVPGPRSNSGPEKEEKK